MSTRPCPPAGDCRTSRRVIAEDLDWFLATVPTLSQLCLQSIVRTFEERPVFEELPRVQKDFIQENLSPSGPLSVTANVVGDGVYWKRCCEQRWGPCDGSHYGHSWKRMFFERHVENIIELFIPGVTDPQTVVDEVALCEKYIKRLDVSQLLPPIKEPEEEEEEKKSDCDAETPSMDHFDFSTVLDKLTCLEELSLVYRVKECGMNFAWSMFEMTDRDCASLAKAVKSCKTLKVLRLRQSCVDDNLCRRLVKHLLDHPSLRELDFSHNRIRDRGARAIGKLLNNSKLETLNLCDNIIRDPGAKAIALALSSNCSLLSLSLRLNCLEDEGGEAIGQALLKNNTLLHLHLGANRVTGATAIALSKVLAQNNILKSISLSCNNLGEDGGKALEEAMSYNTSVTKCELGLTEVDAQIVFAINQRVRNNKRLGETTSSAS